MKAPLNTDNWSGSIKSNKAPLNTDDWNGFISPELAKEILNNVGQPSQLPVKMRDEKELEMLIINRKKLNDAIANYGGAGVDIVDKNSILTYSESLEKDKKLKQRNTILFALLLVGGFIAYKKFKK